MVANKELIKKRGITEKGEQTINELHEVLLICEKDMEYNDVESNAFQGALENWREAKGLLQKEWGFDVDSSMWEEYRLPKCTCPKMDNDDVGKFMFVDASCPIHGDTPKNEKMYTSSEVYEILADNYMIYDDLDEYWDVVGEIFK